MKPIVWTRHAEEAVVSRELKKTWVEDAIRNPRWQDVDPDHANRTRFFRLIPDLDNRVIRVVCEETREHVVIVKVFIDRRAGRKMRAS